MKKIICQSYFLLKKHLSATSRKRRKALKHAYLRAKAYLHDNLQASHTAAFLPRQGRKDDKRCLKPQKFQTESRLSALPIII